MIEKLKELIKADDFNGFKAAFTQATVNAHHRELLYEISYRKQSKEIYEFMEQRAALSQEKKINVFLKTLIDGTKIKDFKTVQNLDDALLAQQIGKYSDALAKSQDSQFMKNFLDTYPLTSFLNFKRIMFGGFKYNHEEFIDHVTKQQIDKNLVFYCALCAINFRKRECFSTLLFNSMKHNPKILDEVKDLKTEYSIVMRGRKTQEAKEEFEAFINETLIETFAKHLQEELANKKPIQVTSIKPKKMKI